MGVAISLLQALTQIQEMTLAFVPKILAIFISLLIALPFMAEKLHAEMLRIAARIVSGYMIAIRSCAGNSDEIDISFLPVLAAAFLLTFARVGTMVMLLPGVGELNMPARVRLTIALVLTAILLPAHQKAYTVDLKALAPVLTDAVPGTA